MKIIYAFLLLLFQYNCYAQKSFKGIWEGKLDLGMELRIVFHIKSDEPGKYDVKMDSPDQEAYGFSPDSVYIKNDSIFIGLKSIRMSFSGNLVNDTVMNGVFKQRVELPLSLKKVQSVSNKIRPQTPTPPFPYESVDVTFSNADASIKYGATITYPSIPPGMNYIKAPTYPVAILITGSGAQNRDEEIMKHKPFAVIADALTKRGFLVIRTDDRGVGKTTGNFEKATSLDFVNDIMAITDYIKKYVHADSTKMFLVGHSEGGMIAPMVANRRKDIYGLVLLAGIGIPNSELLLDQGVSILRSTKVSEKSLTAYSGLYKNIISVMRTTTDTLTAFDAGMKKINKWLKTADENVQKELELNSLENRKMYIQSLARTFSSPWFHFLINYDPKMELRNLKNVHVLALNGDKDIQVRSETNLSGFEKQLKKSKVKSFNTESFPGLNHLFQQCNKCTIAEYGELEETFSPLVLQRMADWMQQVMR